MLYTLAQARTKVKRFVDGGSCNNSTVDEAINDALERLMAAEDWDCLEVMTRITTCNACFPLPYNVEKIVACDIDGSPAKVFGRMYQFLHSGPGDLDYRGSASAFQDIVDMGDHYPIMFDIPHEYENTASDVTSTVDSSGGLRLGAFCTDAADVGTSLKVYGFKDGGDVVRDGSTEGQELHVQQWMDGDEGTIFVGPGATLAEGNVRLSEDLFTDVTRVVKADTAGYISLYAIDTTTRRMFFLAKYHPRQNVPQFRRYRLTNKTAGICATNVLALLKMRYVPLVANDDILPIDSLQALKLMVMAITEENKTNLQGSNALAGQARAVLAKKEESRTDVPGTPVILDSDYRTSLGRVMNRRAIL